MRSKRNQEGYLLIDHRNSPGVDEDLIRASGLPNVISVGEGATYESSTVTCSHCQRVFLINPLRTRERAWCRKCDHYICDTCAPIGDCIPFLKVIETTQELAGRNDPTTGSVRMCVCQHVEASHLPLLGNCAAGVSTYCWECNLVTGTVAGEHHFRMADAPLPTIIIAKG